MAIIFALRYAGRATAFFHITRVLLSDDYGAVCFPPRLLPEVGT